MSKTTNPIVLLALIVAAFAVPATAGMHGKKAEESAAQVKKAVEHYAAIANTLSEDSVDGVPEHAEALREMMPVHPEGEEHARMHGKAQAEKAKAHAEHAMDGNGQKCHEVMNQALDTLASDDLQLAEARDAFTRLSEHFVPMARTHFPEGAETAYRVMHCPMAPGSGDWIQTAGEVQNPYHGSKMPRCGNEVAMLGKKSGERKSKTPEHEGHGDYER